MNGASSTVACYQCLSFLTLSDPSCDSNVFAVVVFACMICGKCCSQKSSLITHMQTHTGERPLTCTVCDKSFALKANQRRHMKTGEFPYTCTVCGKGCSLMCDLGQHPSLRLTAFVNAFPTVVAVVLFLSKSKKYIFCEN